VGPRAGMDRCGKISPSPGFDPRTFQPVVSRYTDYAISAPIIIIIIIIIIMAMVVVFKIRIDAVFLKVTKRHSLGRLLPL